VQAATRVSAPGDRRIPDPAPDRYAVVIVGGCQLIAARFAFLERLTPRTEFEHDLFDALTVLFLAPLAPGHVREAVRTAVGETNLEFLLAFMAFIRAAHYWTETHSELTYEADMLALMERHPELGELLLDPAEAEQTRGAIERTRALATLREREEQFQATVGVLQHNLQVREAEAAELGRYRLLVNAVTDYAIYM
jgi:hypothetical protein